jgi:hypothetical protein
MRITMHDSQQNLLRFLVMLGSFEVGFDFSQGRLKFEGNRRPRLGREKTLSNFLRENAGNDCKTEKYVRV